MEIGKYFRVEKDKGQEKENILQHLLVEIEQHM